MSEAVVIDAKDEHGKAVCNDDSVQPSGSIDKSGLIKMALETATALEAATNLTGEQKLARVQDVLRERVHKSAMATHVKQDLLFFINTVLPWTIEAAVAVSKNPKAYRLQQAATTCCAVWRFAKRGLEAAVSRS